MYAVPDECVERAIVFVKYLHLKMEVYALSWLPSYCYIILISSRRRIRNARENNTGISKRVFKQWTSRCQKMKKKKYGTESRVSCFSRLEVTGPKVTTVQRGQCNVIHLLVVHNTRILMERCLGNSTVLKRLYASCPQAR